MIKVADLEIGNKIKFNKDCVVFVRGIESSKVLVSKQDKGVALMSVDRFSHKFDDLMNRVELVEC